MASNISVASCARWLGKVLGPPNSHSSTIHVPAAAVATAAATAAATQEPDEELRNRLLLHDSLEPGDLTAALADGRLLRRLRRRLLRSRRISALLQEGHESCIDADDGEDIDGEDDDEEGEEAIRRRVTKFLDSCRTDFRLPAECLFELADLQPESGADGHSDPERVLRCLNALSQSDSAAVAGLVVESAVAVATEDASISSAAKPAGQSCWDGPVLATLNQFVGFFRACRILARELRESPLSLWSGEAVDAVFGRSVGLLELMSNLRMSVISGDEQLDEALARRENQLAQLYTGHWWHTILNGNRTLKKLEKENKDCLSQVTLALAKLPQTFESAAKTSSDLLQMPMNHVRRLKSAANEALSKANVSAEEMHRLQAVLDVLTRVEDRVNRCIRNTNRHLTPSCEEFESLSWPVNPTFRVDNAMELGRLRHKGSVTGPDNKRVHASLWDRALVLSQSGEVQQVLEIGPDVKFEEVGGGAGAAGGGLGAKLIKRAPSFSFQLKFPSSAQTPSISLSLGCESGSERENWLKAFNNARDAWRPVGFNVHGHCFRRMPTAPDSRPSDACRHCDKPLGCWAHSCERCRVWLHRRCITDACSPTSALPHLRCQPVPRPRKSLKSDSGQKSSTALSWCEAAPIDAETARVRLRQLPEMRPGRRRNFLLCPSSSSTGGGSTTRTCSASSSGSGYQLHVLSGEAVRTYQVESVIEDQMLRIAGTRESFPGLNDLVRHYAANPLPPMGDGEQLEEDVYEVMENDVLIFDSGVADC